jgi:hypothetical protein
LLVFALVFGASLLAIRLRPAFPRSHLRAETESTVRLSMGLIGTMSALVLGLLLSSSKAKYDNETSELVRMSAKVVLLDRVLAHYGADAADARQQLHELVARMINDIWPAAGSRAAQLDPSAATADDVYTAIERLVPRNELQASVKAEALGNGIELGQMRWLIFAQTQTTITTPLMVIVVCWLTAIFFSFGLFAPWNGTVFAMLLLAALSVSGAIFMIMELDQPFEGMIRISSMPMEIALHHLDH